MGLFDMFKKDIQSTVAKYVEKENPKPLIRMALEGKTEEIRLAAIDGLKNFKLDRDSVDTLMELLDEDDNEKIQIAACRALEVAATKRDYDQLMYKETRAEEAGKTELAAALRAAAVEAKQRHPRF